MTGSSSLPFGFFCVYWRAAGQGHTVWTKSFVNAMKVYYGAKTKHIQLYYFPACSRQVHSVRR